MCHIAAAIRMQHNGAVMSSVQCYVCLKPARLCHHLCVCVCVGVDVCVASAFRSVDLSVVCLFVRFRPGANRSVTSRWFTPWGKFPAGAPLTMSVGITAPQGTGTARRPCAQPWPRTVKLGGKT